MRSVKTRLSFTPNLLTLCVGFFSPILWAAQTQGVVARVSDEPARTAVKREEFLLNGTTVLAVPVDGKPLTVDGATAPDSYYVMNGGQLTVTGGAVVDTISGRSSKIDIDSSLVRGGVTISTGVLNIKGSQVDSPNWFGVQLLTNNDNVVLPSVAYLTDSRISGAAYGASVGVTGELTLTNSTLSGIGYLSNVPGNAGLRMTGGFARIVQGSQVLGEENGIYIVKDASRDEQVNRVEIDDSTVTAVSGAAIQVDRYSINPTKQTIAHIYISNNSTLHAGNGRLVDVLKGSLANVKIINSTLSGDLVADDTSTLNVELRNRARLNGNIINGNSVVIDSSGHWQMAADNRIKSLALDGGSVGFAGEGVHTLSVGELSGQGVFDMRINLDNGTGDLLNVTGHASGNHLLSLQNTGVEAVPPEFVSLQVVHIEAGDAGFGLVGGRADLGAYSYALEQQGNDWFVVGTGKIISPSTQSVLALANVGPTLWNSELTTLRSRMGEVRGHEQGGGWIRTYGNRFNASLDSGVDYQQKQRGLSLGADAPIPVSDGHLLVGLMGGYSTSDLDMGRGSSGTVDSYYVGAYGTWLSDDGYYLDGVLKLNKFHNDSKVAMSDGGKAKGSYSNTGVGGSVEFGKHIKLANDSFVEPFVQLSSVWIDGADYTLDNGLRARNSQTQSVLGKVGSTIGRDFALADGGVIQPYVRVAMAHEFSRSNDVKVNDQHFNNDLFGSRAELGAGVSVALSERLQLHADFDYLKGRHVEQPWGANLGLRLAF